MLRDGVAMHDNRCDVVAVVLLPKRDVTAAPNARVSWKRVRGLLLTQRVRPLAVGMRRIRGDELPEKLPGLAKGSRCARATP